MSAKRCAYWWTDSCPDDAAVHLYPAGWRCDLHSPAALEGRTIPTPDPARTVDGLAAAARTARAADRAAAHAAAVVERDTHVARVDTAADPAWKDQARRAIWHAACTRPVFTADDVWEVLEAWGVPAPAEPRALGPVMTRAIRSGAIIDTGRMDRSRRRHATKITIYEKGTP